MGEALNSARFRTARSMSLTPSASEFAEMRDAMIVSQLRTCEVNDAAVLKAFRSVARENFVAEAHRSTCYHDRAAPLPGGRMLNPPLALGRMVGEADFRSTDRVLIIGGGSGYSAAVVAQLVQHVTMVEENTELLAMARAALAGTTNISITEAPLTAGDAVSAPYDVILIDGAVEEVSAALVDQLAENGRLVTGWLDGGITRLALGRRSGGSFALAAFADMEVAPLAMFNKERSFQF